MRRVVRAAVSALICCLLWAGAARAEYDPCADLVEVSEEENVLRWNLLNFFREEPPEPLVGEGGDRPYYVTVRAGRFANVSCNEDGFEWQEMYPIGVVLRKLGDVQIEGWHDAGGGRPILVQTEYGHRKIVSDRNVEPMVANATYIFADSYAKSMICRDAADCPGNGEDICDDARCRYDISAKWGYAIAPSSDETVQAAVAAYRLLRADRLLLPGIDLEPEEQDKAEADICEPFPVKAYLRGSELAQPRDSYFTFCFMRASEGAPMDGYAPLKVVDLEWAEERFGQEGAGSFHRRFGEGPTSDERILAALGNVRLSATKPCGVEVSNIGTLNFGGGFAAKADAGILEVNLGAERSELSRITQTLPAEDFLLFSTYFIEPIPRGAADADDGGDELWLFRIMFRSVCVDGTPRRSTSIKVFYEQLRAGSIEIAADGPLFETYAESSSNYSYVPSTDPAFLAEGQFWQIVDHIGYFIWRDTLREYFYRVPGTNDLILSYPLEQRPFVRDFFVHLMLAAAYHHLDPESY